MSNYTNEELNAALREVSSTISKCEKIHGKFAEGTPQYSLLRNRIKAMIISKLLIEYELSPEEQMSRHQTDDSEGTVHYRRNKNLIKAMEIAKALIEAQLALDEISGDL
jgi:hypothetical protein